ncbi:hypothetical protein FA13DRAFT_1332018 [Coprinellus micaceus]|uniref:Uncharacterized protein n=1 Tax=Coprinellus micaceus TaxID=71717 RepID=A0A4Y7TNY9_COPMI|nr:hypothetical protein FA13DRAFT_1332018 [Coprinellus micaceus]
MIVKVPLLLSPDRSTHRDVVCVHRLRFRHLAHCPNQCISTSNKIGAQGAYSATLDLPAPITSDISTDFTPVTGRARYSIQWRGSVASRADRTMVVSRRPSRHSTFNVQHASCTVNLTRTARQRTNATSIIDGGEWGGPRMSRTRQRMKVWVHM